MNSAVANPSTYVFAEESHASRAMAFLMVLVPCAAFGVLANKAPAPVMWVFLMCSCRYFSGRYWRGAGFVIASALRASISARSVFASGGLRRRIFAATPLNRGARCKDMAFAESAAAKLMCGVIVSCGSRLHRG